VDGLYDKASKVKEAIAILSMAALKQYNELYYSITKNWT
jgi:hypothetical protein